MFFTTTDPRMMLQRRLDADAKRSNCCRPRSDEEAAEATACCAESEDAAVAQRPLFAKRQPKDSSGGSVPQVRPPTDE
jgi:hypothetical protein